MAQTAATIRHQIEQAKTRLQEAQDNFEACMIEAHGIGLRPGDFTFKRSYNEPALQESYELWVKRNHELAALWLEEDKLIEQRHHNR